MNRIERIERMEEALDSSREAVNKLSEALRVYEANFKKLSALSAYYGSAKWMSDFEADEKGKLPKDLKRGVLSEDAVYDLLIENRELVARMAKLVANSIESFTL